MSAFPSNYLVDKINDLIYKGTAPSLGSSRYLALYTTNPTAANTGIEASGGSYARQLLSFASSVSGSSATNASVTFTNMAEGTYTHYGVFDAVTGGNLIVYGLLTEPVDANAGDQVVIPSGNGTFGLTGS